MNNQETVLNYGQTFKQKSGQLGEEQAYYSMLADVVSELIQLAHRIEDLEQKSVLKNVMVLKQWDAIVEELCELFGVLEEESFKVIKGKRIYETMDEVIADLEDWIETVNEEYLEQEQMLPYFESWDIGVFF